MRIFHECGVMDKVMLSSDWPLTEPQENIDGLRNMNKFAADHHLPGIPEDEIEGTDDGNIDEISAVGSAGAGGIRGYSAPMSTKNTKKSRVL